MRESLFCFRVEEIRKVVGRTAEHFRHVVHAEFRIGELFAHQTFRLKHFSYAAVELARAGFDDVSEQTEQRDEQSLEHCLTCRTFSVEGLREAVRQGRKNIEIWRIGKFDTLENGERGPG